MLHLKFEGMSPLYAVTLGPAAWYRIAGNRIRQAPDGEVVAELRKHQWVISGQSFSRVTLDTPCRIHFEDVEGTPTSADGPFPAVLIADGALYAGDRLYARFAEESQLWHNLTTETFWPAVVFSLPAPH